MFDFIDTQNTLSNKKQEKTTQINKTKVISTHIKAMLVQNSQFSDLVTLWCGKLQAY